MTTWANALIDLHLDRSWSFGFDNAKTRAGHGPRWKAVAKELGYEGKRLHDGAIADEFAPWVGACPNGHVHYRYRTPTRALACGKCSRSFDPRFTIEWTKR